jgi:hypothetical protein
MALQLTLWGIFVLVLRIALGPLSAGWVIGSVIVAGVISVFLVLRVIGHAVMRRQFAGLASSRHDYTVHLNGAGVSYTCGKISTQLPWDAVDRVVDKRGCILLFFDDLAALVVPRRAFATAAGADAFLSFAQLRTGLASRPPAPAGLSPTKALREERDGRSSSVR